MKVEELKEKVTGIDAISNESWMQSLDERKKKELEFHNVDRDPERRKAQDTYEKFYGNRKFYGAVGLSTEYVDQWIAHHAKGKVFLDYACGRGQNTLKAARAGAALAMGFDISDVSVRICRERAQEAGVEANTVFFQADAENTRLPDHCVDTIICSGMLHHLDLSYAFPELRRILKPGGRLLAVEALDYNPAIKLYRMMTPEMRTDWEKHHILSLRDVRFAKNFFDIGEIRYWHLTSILYPYMKPLLPLLNGVDRVLTRIPGVQLMAWMFTFELVGKEK